MWRKISIIIGGLVLFLGGCKDGGANSNALVETQDDTEEWVYEEILSDFLSITNLESAGEVVNGYWQVEDGNWSKTADIVDGVSLSKVCELEGIELKKVKGLQGRLASNNIYHLKKKEREFYFLVKRSGLVVGGEASYVVYSKNKPTILGGEVNLLRDDNWWSVKVR